MPQPNKIPLAFAASGDKNIIPESTETTGLASWRDGFPAITSTPFSEGGIAPKRADFNGIFNALSLALLWQQQGGFYAYDNTTDYEVGNVIEYNNDLYKCITANGPGSAVKAPTDTTAWSKVMTAADAAALYLPLSGGEMTGDISNGKNPNEFFRIYGGTGTDTGARLALAPSNLSGYEGEFWLVARNSNSGDVALKGRPNGELIWNNHHIAVVDSVDSAGNGYIRFTNRLQILWGRTQIPFQGSSSGVAVTWEKPFSAEPNIFFGTRFANAYGWGYGPQAMNRTATGCTVYCGMSSGGTAQAWSGGNICYIAVGPWA